MQTSLFSGEMRREFARTEHGGTIRRHRRKLERPVSTRRPMHVVLSSRHAGGAWNLKKHDRTVRGALRDMSRRFGVSIYDFANVGSHLHLLLRSRRREEFQRFLRSFAGIVARRVTGARRGQPAGRFFTGLAWSRVVRWGRDYMGVRHYVFRNQIEAAVGAGIRRALEQGPRPMRRGRSPRAAEPPRPTR